MTCKQEPLVYYDEPDRKVVDLRPFGVPFIPLASRTICRYTRNGPGLHVHKGFSEIVFCVRGALSFDTPGRVYAFRPGDVFVSGPREPHAMSINLKGAFVYRVLVSLPRPGKHLPGLTVRETAYLVRMLGNGSRRLFHGGDLVRRSFERLFDLCFTDRDVTDVTKAARRLCALDLLLCCAEAAERDCRHPVPACIRQLVEDMERNPVNRYDLAGLMSRAGMTAARFNAEFKRAVGLPPHSYLIVQRIGLARRLMSAHPDRSMVSLSLELGFSSVPHFSSAFKRVSGITFSQCIRQLKERR